MYSPNLFLQAEYMHPAWRKWSKISNFQVFNVVLSRGHGPKFWIHQTWSWCPQWSWSTGSIHCPLGVYSVQVTVSRGISTHYRNGLLFSSTFQGSIFYKLDTILALVIFAFPLPFVSLFICKSFSSLYYMFLCKMPQIPNAKLETNNEKNVSSQSCASISCLELD